MRVMSTSFCSAACESRGRRDHVGKGVGEVTLPNDFARVGYRERKDSSTRADRVGTVTP